MMQPQVLSMEEWADFLLKNPDFLIRNPDFRLKNVDYIMKHAVSLRNVPGNQVVVGTLRVHSR